MGYYGAIAHTTLLKAELRAIRQGLKMAVLKGITTLDIESDLRQAMDIIIIGTPILDNLIFDCRYWLSQLARWVLRHAFREQNQLADCMAKEGTRNGGLGNVSVFVSPPAFVRNQLLSDSIGACYL